MRRRLALLTLALSLLPAATASAADFSATLDANTPKYSWESSGSGVPYLLAAQSTLQQCAGFPAGTDCDNILLNVGTAGELQLTLESPEGQEGPTLPGDAGPFLSFQDIDGILYKSNAAGEQQGDPLSDGDPEGEPDCLTSFPSEQCKVNVTPGYYLLVVEYYFAEAAPMKGTAELLGVTPTPPGTTTPTPTPSGNQPTATPTPSGNQPTPTPTPSGNQPPPSQQPGQQQNPGTPLPRSGPLRVRVTAASSKRSAARKRGLRVRVRCSVQCKATAVAKVSKKVARKLKLGKKAVRISKRGRATITKAGRKRFSLKLKPKVKKALARRRKVKKFAVKIVVKVTDRRGRQAKRVTKKIKLR